MINSKTKLNMVIGNPLEHSQSPLLHNTIYALLNCNAVMLAQPTDNLPTMIEAIKTLNVGLTAVTMPFKQDILNYLDEVSSDVEALKAANTVINRDGKLIGYNTDVTGVAYALRNITVANKTVLMIGAGGAAHAAAYYLKKNHAQLLWLNRTQEHALALIALFGGKLVDNHTIKQMPIDIIINTTPLGMHPHIDNMPIDDYSFNSKQIVFDMVYNPIDTLLLKTAKSQGAACISGLEMFIGQGIKQTELWLNQSVQTSNMIDLLHHELKKTREQ